MFLDLDDQISNLEPGGHLCLLYEKDPAEQMPALIPFIRDGLARNEQFIYIADDQTVAELASHLQKNDIDVTGQTHSGRLRLCTRKEWRQPGELDPAKKAQQVRQFIADAAKAGFRGIRFAVEMTWTLGPDIDPHVLEVWEATINTLFSPDFPGRIICQYNRSRLSPALMLAALHTHPLAIVGQDVYPNVFYQAPLLFDGHDYAHGNGHSNGHSNGNGNGSAMAARVEWMLEQLKRARAAEKQREELLIHQAALAELNRADELHRHFAAIVASSDDAIISKDLNGIIHSWNQGAERIFGYTAEEIIGKPITVLIPPGRENEEPQILARLRRGERIDHYETLRRRKDGSIVNISLTVSPVKDASGKIMGASKIARDITGQKRANEEIRAARDQLAQLNRELEERVEQRTARLSDAISQMEEFSYTVSHDLRAPARAMKSYAEIVLDDFGQNLDPQARDYLERIVRGGARMDSLIQDVLTYSRLGRRDMELRPVALDNVVADIVHQYPQLQLPRAKTSVRAPLLPVVAHEPSLAQAVSNLLINAAKFMPPEEVPQITVRTESRGDQVRLWVEDNGIGIKPEHQHRLFGIFERIPTSGRYEGTGIGLAIVRKAVEKMGGAVGVESDGLTGSRFWIQLPAA